MFLNFNTKEIFEEWEDNTQYIFDSKLEDSYSFLSYSIDNETDSKIYLDEKYIYIIKKNNNKNVYERIENSLKLKSIKSPLIIKENSYYFCSSTSLIKIEEQKIEEVKIQGITDKISSLSCYYSPSKNSIIVGLIGTKFILNYDLEQKNWNEKEKIELKGNLITMNCYNINEATPLFISISKDDNQKYYLNKFELVGNKINFLNDNNLTNFEFTDSSNIIISFLGEKIAVIFTYILEQSFNLYHYSFEENKTKLIGKNFLPFFKEYSFINAKFIENTPIIYYTITRNGRYFLGVADLQYFIILYNTEIFNKENVIYDEGYLYKSKGFLNYFEYNIQKKVCPFVLNGTLCQYNLENKYLAISKRESNGFNYYFNYFTTSCSNGQKLGKYCVENCPIGSMSSGMGNCVQCNYNVFFNFADKSCSNTCEYNKELNICYDCERKNQIFYENNCIENNDCSGLYQIYDKNSKTCVKCEKYFNIGNKGCVEECPPNSEKMKINDVEICIDCKSLKMYSLTLNGMNYCYRKCPINYSTNDNNLKCEKCSNDTIFENGKCVNKCSEPYSRSNIKEINYCLSCNTLQKFVSDGKCIDKCDSNSDLKYEENGICKDSCSFGYVLNGTKCKKCQENGTYYEKGICKDKCSEKLGWNETDNICTNCAEFGYYLEGHKCVINCKQSSRISQDEKLCITCPDNSPYYSAGDCVPKCNNNSILDKFTGYCNFCSDDTNFLDNKCLKSCPEPYISEIIDNRHICSICKKDEWYVARTCQKTCKGGTFSSDDNACHMCYCGRDGRGECKVSDSNKCENCDTIEDDEREAIFDYFGYSCEFCRTFKYSENRYKRYLKIQPFYNTSINSNITFFNFTLNKTDPYKNYTYKEIKWKFIRGKDELTSIPKYKRYFVTGTDEEIFGINPYLYDSEKNNFINLTLVTNDETFTDEIIVYVQDITILSEHEVSFSEPKYQDTGYIHVPMNSTIEINQVTYSNNMQYKYYYKFSFLDDNDEEFPLSNFENPRWIITYYIPFAKKYFVTLKNDRGELKKYSIKKDNSNIYYQYNNYEYNSESIKNIINYEKYNNIEKIFIFMIIFNSKERILNKNEFLEIFDFIDGSYININNKKDENKKYLINYSEPKVLFSLINSIIISQKKILDSSYINRIIDSLENCINLLNKQDNENHKMNFNSSDIISLIRTMEQLHDVYNEQLLTKEFSDKNEILGKFYNLFNKISVYLSSNLYPAEGIKIIGSTTVFFSFRFGYYQKLLAISSNDLTSPANISNISTYSYEDYGLNEEKCFGNGKTFLCMEKDIYSDIKSKLIQNGNNDIKNIAFNIIIVNNIKKQNQDKKDNKNEDNDDYLVHFQFYDLKRKENINEFFANNSLFYSLEFSYRNEKKKINNNQEDNNEFYMPYNYSNVFCYPKNYKKSDKYYCFTHFNYITNIIQCKCNIIDDISITENENLANYYKSLQFKSVNYTYTNKCSKIFLILFLTLLLIPGLLFLLYDIFRANKIINKNDGIDFKEERRDYYNQVRIYTDSTISFAIFSTFNEFPYCSAFNANHYTSPKFIKHLIVVTALLLGFILNLIPFFFSLPFEEKQILIDKRDIKLEEEVDIHSIRLIKKYVIIGFICSFISLICVHLFIKLFNKILKIEEKNTNYWKKIKDILKDYMYFEIKKNRNFGKNFSTIKKRIKAFYALCGRYLLNKNIMTHPDRDKKLENYIKYTGKMNKSNKFLENKKIEVYDISKNKDNKIGTEKEPLLYELPKNDNNIINDNNNIKTTSEYTPPNINTNTYIKKSAIITTSADSNQEIKLGDILKKIRPIKSDSFQISKITNNRFDITKNTINRLEKIKYKYINSGNTNISKYFRKIANINIEPPLVRCYNDNITILNFEEYSENNKKDTSNTGTEICLLVIMTCIIGFIFFFLLFIGIIIINYLMNKYEYFMVKIWILCSIVILVICYFLLYLIKIIIGSLLLFKYYHKRKSGCFYKFLFKIFVNKNLIYMFKIRNYITKYRREFINI